MLERWCVSRDMSYEIACHHFQMMTNNLAAVTTHKHTTAPANHQKHQNTSHIPYSRTYHIPRTAGLWKEQL